MTGEGAQAPHLSLHRQYKYLDVCSKKVLNAALGEGRNACDYGIFVDGTSDVSHVEQLVFSKRDVHAKELGNVNRRGAF